MRLNFAEIWYLNTYFLSLTQKICIMKLRIAELLQDKGLRMKDLADKMGMDLSNLKKSLSGNPKLSTLVEVATALSVETHELFTANLPSRPKGIAVIGGRTYALINVPTVVQVPAYDNYSLLRLDIESFVKKSISREEANAFCAIVEGYELVSIVYDYSGHQFITTLYYGDSMSKTSSYDLLEYDEWNGKNNDDPICNLEQLCGDIIAQVEEGVPFKFKDYAAHADREESLDQDDEF